MSDSIQKMIKYYDDRARWHDDYMSYTDYGSFEKRELPIIQEIIPLLKNRNVLELACGTGNWTQVLSKYSKTVHAVDSSEQSLELAKVKLRDLGNISYKCQDVFKFHSEDKYDVLFSADFWSHIPNSLISTLLESLLRSCHDKSVMIMIDMTMKDFFTKEEVCIDRDNNRVSLRILPDGTKHDVIKNFPTESDLKYQTISYFPNFKYYRYSQLERWMMICR